MTINLLLSAYAAPALPSRSSARIAGSSAEMTPKPQIRSRMQPRHGVSQARVCPAHGLVLAALGAAAHPAERAEVSASAVPVKNRPQAAPK